MKIVIAGGSGYLGRLVARYFGDAGWEVLTLARRKLDPAGPFEKILRWDGERAGPWAEEMEGADVLLNLAGRTVNCRYTAKHRREILESRTRSTAALGQALGQLPAADRPKVWLNSSTATIYRHAVDEAQDETRGEIGKGFSAGVAEAWEAAFSLALPPGVRGIALRSAMVFGPGEGGVYGAFAGLAKSYLGGRHGSGRQFVSWIHHEDFCRALCFLIETESITGPVNLAAPDPRPNWEFQRALRRSLGRSLGFPTPELVLEVGAYFRGTETELLLKSRRVIPGRLTAAGFSFSYPKLESAFANLAGT